MGEARRRKQAYDSPWDTHLSNLLVPRLVDPVTDYRSGNEGGER
jgi:hypothetical protein